MTEPLAGYYPLCNKTLRHKVARPGRNPATDEPKEISARSVVTFKPGKKLLQRMPTEQG